MSEVNKTKQKGRRATVYLWTHVGPDGVEVVRQRYDARVNYGKYPAFTQGLNSAREQLFGARPFRTGPFDDIPAEADVYCVTLWCESGDLVKAPEQKTGAQVLRIIATRAAQAAEAQANNDKFGTSLGDKLSGIQVDDAADPAGSAESADDIHVDGDGVTYAAAAE